jgi:ML domain-containing protein
VKQTVDLCDQVKNVNMTCPIDEGDVLITKDVDLPKQIPPVRAFETACVVHLDANIVTGFIQRSSRCLYRS